MSKVRSMKGLVVGALCACALVATALAAGCAKQEAYTPPEPSPTLSKPTIGTEGTLRVGVNADNAPLAGQPESSSKTVGIDVDVAAAIADNLGLKLEVVNVGDDAENALKQGQVDIVMGVSSATSVSTSFWKSDTYLPTSVAVFASSASATPPTDDASTTIGVQVSSTSAWAVTNAFDKATINTSQDLRSAFDSLSSGSVRYVAADAVVGSYIASNAGDEAHIVALLQQPTGYSVGVLDGNTQLKQAISGTLATLKGNGIISVIEKKWLGEAIDLSSVKVVGEASGSASGSSSTAGSTDSGSASGSAGSGTTGSSTSNTEAAGSSSGSDASGSGSSTSGTGSSSNGVGSTNVNGVSVPSFPGQ